MLFNRHYTSEKPYALEPGKHYICEVQAASVDVDNIRDVVEELEKADIHLHVVYSQGNHVALDMKTVREESK
jgi:hypothetical protein